MVTQRKWQFTYAGFKFNESKEEYPHFHYLRFDSMQPAWVTYDHNYTFQYPTGRCSYQVYKQDLFHFLLFIDDVVYEQRQKAARRKALAELNKRWSIPARPRDSQRSKVYTAEQKTSSGKHFKDIDEVRMYIAKIARTQWWKKLAAGHPVENGPVRLEIGRSHSTALSFHGMRTVRMPGKSGWAYCEKVVLHEMAHLITDCTHSASHGPEFCKNFLTLVKYRMGKDAAEELKRSFKTHKVKYTVRRKQ